MGANESNNEKMLSNSIMHRENLTHRDEPINFKEGQDSVLSSQLDSIEIGSHMQNHDSVNPQAKSNSKNQKFGYEMVSIWVIFRRIPE